MYLKNVKGFYNQNAEYFSHTRKWLWKDMALYLGIVKDNDKLLDLGCGNGRLLTGIKKSVNYTGVDFSKELIKLAKKKHGKNKFIVGDITNKDVWKKLGTYGVIYCIAVLHHIESRQKQLFILRQVKKHLKPGGKAVFSVWSLWRKQYLKYHLSKESLKLKLRGFRYLWVPFQNTHQRFCVSLGSKYLYNLFKEAGFGSIAIESRGKNIWICVKV